MASCWGQRGVPHRRRSGGAGEGEPDRLAARLAGVEPGGEPAALPAIASLVPPGVPGLRSLAGCGGRVVESRLPGSGEDPVDLRGPVSVRAQITLPFRMSRGPG